MAQAGKQELPRDSRAELKALLDAAVDAVVIIDAHGTIEAFSAAAERMFGYRAEDVIGRNVSSLMPESIAREHDGYIDAYVRTGHAKIIGKGREVIAQRHDGTQFPAEIAVGEVASGKDEPPRFIGFVRDISQTVREHQELIALREQLTHAGRVAAMGEMTTSIAHELNQPLTAIATYAQACRRKFQNDPSNEQVFLDCIDKVERQALRAGDIIDKLRQFLRRQRGESVMFLMTDIVEDVVQLAEPDARLRNTVIEVRLPDEPVRVLADPVQIQQVLLNLLLNAMDAMRLCPPDERVVTVALSLDNDNAVVDVDDVGEGVAPEHETMLFEPYFSTKPHGIGIGLSICRSIVTTFGGMMRYTRRAEAGSRFTFTLPVANGSANDE